MEDNLLRHPSTAIAFAAARVWQIKNERGLSVPQERIQTGFEAFDIDAREAQVIGKGQRIAPMAPDQFTPEALELANAVRTLFGVTDLSGIPDIFATMFKHPGIYRSQMQLGLELNKQGTLPPRERELAILRVAWLVRSPFEWGEHVEVGKQCGLSAEEIDRVPHGSAAEGWSEHDRALLRAVEELVGDHAISDETWEVLARSWTEQQMIELPGLVGSYVLTAMLYNSLRFALLEGNTGLRHR
jgi:4-carboxymuconolactone decarboxylase